MSHAEDIQIINRVVNGDTEAFAGIVEKYQNMIFKYVYTQTGNYDDALDMTQDIFIMAMKALKTFRQESKFSTWLYSIMVNYCRNHRKKHNRVSFVSVHSLRGEEEQAIDLPDHRERPEEDIVNRDSLRIVKEEIYSLPDDYKEILILREIDGLSYNEIADVVGIGLSNVKVRIHRAREMLKNRLNERGLL